MEDIKKTVAYLVDGRDPKNMVEVTDLIFTDNTNEDYVDLLLIDTSKFIAALWKISDGPRTPRTKDLYINVPIFNQSMRFVFEFLNAEVVAFNNYK